jgi:hypothetical protein
MQFISTGWMPRSSVANTNELRSKANRTSISSETNRVAATRVFVVLAARQISSACFALPRFLCLD